METLQTVNEIVVDLYPYKFSVSETREYSPRIVVALRKLSGRDFERNESELIVSIFNDIGKWESFAQITSSVLRELGLSQSEESNQNSHYSPEKYAFEEATTGDETLRRFIFRTSQDERYRREALEIPRLTTAEIAKGIENVGKWRSLAQTARLLRSLTA
jgi:hypothetical protein